MPVSQAHTAQRDNRNVPSTSRVVSVRTTYSLMRFKRAAWGRAQVPTTCSGVDLSWVPTVPSLTVRLIPRRRLPHNTRRALQHKPSIQATSVAQTIVRTHHKLAIRGTNECYSIFQSLFVRSQSWSGTEQVRRFK
jgi:hypothetical protein